MFYHVVVKNGHPQWFEPSTNYFQARKSAANLNGFYSYGLFSYKVKSFWTYKSAMNWIEGDSSDR
jgi:hypothetical protein